MALPRFAFADASVDYNKALKQAEYGNFQAAIDLLDRAIDSGELSSEHTAKAYYDRGLANGRLGRSDKAQRDFESAVIYNSSNVKAWSSICYEKTEKRENLDEALDACNEALRLDPLHGPTYNIHADIWYRKGNNSEAEKDYKHSVRLDSDNWLVYFNRGVFYDDIGQPDNARRDLTAAYVKAPAWGRTHSGTLSLFKKYGLAE